MRTQRTDLWTQPGKERMGQTQTAALKQIYHHVASGKLLHNTGSPTCRSLGLGKFKKEGTHVYFWQIHVVERQKPTGHCKAIILQLKINLKTEKKNLVNWLNFSFLVYKTRNHQYFTNNTVPMRIREITHTEWQLPCKRQQFLAAYSINVHLS